MAERQARIPPNMGTPVPPFVHQSLAMGLPVAGKKDDIDEMTEGMAKDMVRISKLKMVRDTLNPQPQQQQLQPPIDYSGVFKALGDMNNNLATQLTTMIAQNSQNAQNPAILEVKHQVEKVAEKLENVSRGNQQSELETLFNGMARMDAMGGILRKSLGIPDSVKTTTGDLPQLLGMEQLRMQDNREQRNHEEKMFLLKHDMATKEKMDDKRFNLEVLKFAEDRKHRESNGKMFEDLISSVMEGIDLTPNEKAALGVGGNPEPDLPPAGYQPPSPVVQEAPLRPRVKAFTCQVCGIRVEVPSPDQATIDCPKCTTTYNLNPEAPAAPPPPSLAAEMGRAG